jgi:SAM-dependent methyltransferase
MRPVSAGDQLRWDAVYAARGQADGQPAAPTDFRGIEHLLPTTGRALDVACGRGGGAVWLARRGMQVWGVDISAVAIDHARASAAQWQVADRCRFDVVDLDHGLPPGLPADLVLCHRFWAPDLRGAVMARLASGGVLAISVLSEVGAEPGRYRAAPGELVAAFGDLEHVRSGEGQGIAWLLARKP